MPAAASSRSRSQPCSSRWRRFPRAPRGPRPGSAVGTGAGTQSLAALVADDARRPSSRGPTPAPACASRTRRERRCRGGLACGGALSPGHVSLGASGDGANGIILFFVAPRAGQRRACAIALYGVRFTAEGQTPPGWSASGNVFPRRELLVMDDLGWEQVYVTHAMPWSQGGAVFFVRWYRDPGRAGCHAIAIPQPAPRRTSGTSRSALRATTTTRSPRIRRVASSSCARPWTR